MFILVVLRIYPGTWACWMNATPGLPAQLDGCFWLLTLYSSRSQWLFSSLTVLATHADWLFSGAESPSFIYWLCLYTCNLHHPPVIHVDCGFLCLQWFIIYHTPCFNQVFSGLFSGSLFLWIFFSFLTNIFWVILYFWHETRILRTSALGSDSFPGSQCLSEVGQCIVGHWQTYETT